MCVWRNFCVRVRHATVLQAVLYTLYDKNLCCLGEESLTVLRTVYELALTDYFVDNT